MIRPFKKVLVIDAGGTPKDWISARDAILCAAKDSVVWVPPTAISSTVFGGTCAKTGLTTTLEIASIMAIRGPMMEKLMSMTYRVPRVTARALFARDHHRCAYCGNYFDTDDLTKDHIIPKKLKGKNTWQNLISACKPCNGRKADRTPERAGMRLKYEPYVPSRMEYLYFTNKNISPEQIDYLESYVRKQKNKPKPA